MGIGVGRGGGEGSGGWGANSAHDIYAIIYYDFFLYWSAGL